MASQPNLFLGVASRDRRLALVGLVANRPAVATTLPATAIGAEAIRIFIGDHEGPAGIASDTALIDLALARGRGTLATTMLASSGSSFHALGFARCARTAT